jgi:hypothetical protein
MSFNVNEIKSWAKSRGFVVKKAGEGYVWWGEGVDAGHPAPIEEVATDIFNRITDGRFVEHQREFRRSGGIK